jgi:hypothetical protein
MKPPGGEAVIHRAAPESELGELRAADDAVLTRRQVRNPRIDGPSGGSATSAMGHPLLAPPCADGDRSGSAGTGPDRDDPAESQPAPRSR